ncbi:MAG TPA: DNA recombination protein RmuC [Aridibacter sp.]|nr:DNA recombination protein RmuC [Aridibacter sp.]
MDPATLVLGLIALVLFAAVAALFFKNQRIGADNASLSTTNARLEAENASGAEQLMALKDEQEKLRETAKTEFENIASKLLETKSEKFTELNKKNIADILGPLGKEIEGFKKRVEETYDKESKERFSLQKEVQRLIEQTGKVSQEANNLAVALKGQAKAQGDWGEMILERVLEVSGLRRGHEYDVQVNLKAEDGSNQRPDFVVNLPEDRKLVIDSKVSLTAYERFTSAETDEERAQALKDHLASVSNHIDQLSEKKYDELQGSLDFVLLFVAIEPAYLLAMHESPELWAKAYSKKVILTSPTNLITAVKLIADLWKRELQSRNALEIARQGQGLYEKFVGFLTTMDEIGKHLNNSQLAYSKAVGQLKEGRGNLVKRAEDLKKLGLNTKKSLPASMGNYDEEE